MSFRFALPLCLTVLVAASAAEAGRVGDICAVAAAPWLDKLAKAFEKLETLDTNAPDILCPVLAQEAEALTILKRVIEDCDREHEYRRMLPEFAGYLDNNATVQAAKGCPTPVSD